MKLVMTEWTGSLVLSGLAGTVLFIALAYMH